LSLYKGGGDSFHLALLMKVALKIFGCFRTAEGAENFATLRSVLSTARKQGWSVLNALQQKPLRRSSPDSPALN
jgi:hypothetical protein